jgi:hypothetical protein
MNIDALNLLMLGALSACSWVAALFFLRFWTSTAERLFAFLAAAFGLLGMHWVSLAIVHWSSDTRHEPYFLRLLAFSLILFGIIDKNRRAARTPGRVGPSNDPPDGMS